MKVMCEMSTRPIGIHNNVIKWVFCPYLIKSKRKVQKANVKNCEECRFFIAMKITERPGTASNHKRQIKGTGGRSAIVAGHIRTRSIIGTRPRLKRGECKTRRQKTVYIKKELKDGLAPLVDVFDEGDKVRILTEIPLHYMQEEITLEYENKNGNRELVILVRDYKQHIPIKNELAAELTGDVELCSLKSGVVNAELKKEVTDGWLTSY